ncbi:Heparinase II/III-like protein [Opitutaceae bacterium TAV1]|nr:Heparinase II/III-like protein [Opitutaceae bacterium TAV1]
MILIRKLSPMSKTAFLLPCLCFSLLCMASPVITPALFAASSPAPAAPATIVFPETLPAHPRLFARADDWTALRTRIAADPVSQQLFSLVRAEADALLAAPPVPLVKEGRRLLGPVRDIQGRVFRLALAYRLTDDTRYLDRALVEMRHLANAPDWNPSHFLDTAEAALALGTGYDWLHDQLAEADRTLIEDALITKALQPSFAAKHGWISGNNNWNQVCHGGLVAAALAIAERDPDLARRTVERACANLQHAAHAYAPDGAYVEGPMYWDYGTTFHVLLVESLRTALDTTAGLDAFPGFLASADYIQQVTTPASRFFNYGDAVERRGFSPALFWFARQSRRADLIRYDLAALQARATHTRPGWGGRFLPFALLWRDPTLSASTGPETAPLHWFGRGPNPVGIHRSAWNDPRAVYLAIKGGSPSNNHAHMDAGSFILEADGVLWAVDTGMQSYHSLESVGLKLWSSRPDGDRWKVFRLGPESHNIPRVNGAPQVWNAAALPLRSRADGPAPFTQFDLTPLYADQVARFHRGVALLADHRTILQDEWTALPDRPATVTFQWLTRANVSLDSDRRTLRLRQAGKTLQLRVPDPLPAGAPVDITVEDTAALLSSWDAPNPGLKRILFRISTAAGESSRLVIEATPGTTPATTSASPATVRPLAEW